MSYGRNMSKECTMTADVTFSETMSLETCTLCGKGKAQSSPMFTRDFEAWICPQCVRECFLRLAEEKEDGPTKQTAV